MSSPTTRSLTIVERWKGRVIASVPTDSQGGAIHTLVRSGVSLRNADLRGFTLNHIFLRGADLRGADLSGATLEKAYLRGAYLRGADLRGTEMPRANLADADLRGANLADADLAHADLRGANLLGAELHGANLEDARLEGAVLDWHRGTIPAEILRRAAGEPDGHPRLALDLLVHGERDDISWLSLIGRHEGAAAWAIGLLVPYVRRGDNAPPFLKRVVAVLKARARRGRGLPRLAWTRCNPA